MEALLTAVSSVILSVSIGVYAPVIGRRLHIFDHPDTVRKLHSRSTPLVGGFMIVLSVCVFSFFSGISSTDGQSPGHGILAFCCITAFLIGMADDISDLSAVFRLIALGSSIAVASSWNEIMVVRLIHSDLLSFEQGLSLFAIPLTVLAIMATTNALNMLDGINGLFGGVFLIYLAGLWILETYVGAGISNLLLGTILATIVFLIFNLRNRLFMGDSGTYCASVLVGLAAIKLYNQADGAIPAELLGLWFALPILDMTRVSIARIRDARSAFSADRNHFHHILQLRFSKSTSLTVFLIILGVPILSATLDTSLVLPALIAQLVAYSVLVIAFQKNSVAQSTNT